MDVYRWMQSANLFPTRTHLQSRTSNNRQDQDKPKDAFCAVCGLLTGSHRKNKGGKAREGLDVSSTGLCAMPDWLRRMPILDVQELRAYQANIQHQANFVTIGADAHYDLLRVVDPRLTLGVQRAAQSLHLSNFPAPSGPLQGGRAAQDYAPYALLATSVHALVKRLVRGGLLVLDPRFDPGETIGHKGGGTTLSGSHAVRQKLLVPTHIVRGVVEGARRRDGHTQRMLLLCLTRLGIPVGDMDSVLPATAAASLPDTAGALPAP